MRFRRLAVCLVGMSACATQDPVDHNLRGSAAGLSRNDDDCDEHKQSANWRSFGRDYENTRHNPDEDRIVPESVGRLKRTWEVDTWAQTGTAAVVDGVVYTGDAAGAIDARDAKSGELIWKQEIGRPVTSSPLVTEEKVIVSDQGAYLNALSRESGEILWQTLLDTNEYASVFSSPVVVDGIIVLGVASGELGVEKDEYTFRGSVVGIEFATGKVLWSFYTTNDDANGGAGVSVWSSAAIDRKRHRLYIGTGNSYEEPAGKYSDALVAIDYTNGEPDWYRQFTPDDVYRIFSPPPKGTDSDVGAAPNLFSIDGRDVVGVGDKAGVYSVLDRKTGQTVWSERLTEGTPLGGVMVAAAYAHEKIYVASNAWGQETPVDKMPEWDNEANKTRIIALNARDGSTAWDKVVSQPTIGGISVAGGLVYTSTTDGIVRALSEEDGSELWSHQLDNPSAGGLTIADGYLYVGDGFDFAAGLEGKTVAGKLYGFSIE